MRALNVYVAAVFAIAACQKAGNGVSTGSGSASASGTGAASGTGKGTGTGAAPASPAKDIDSKDILARDQLTDEALVKHVLIGWKDLADTYRGRMDKRAADRTNDQAAALAQEIYGKLKANPDSIDDLVKQYSEDPGSLRGKPYTVTPQAGFVPEFKKLSLRLNVKEVGIVQTPFGYHVIERVAPPPPDPLESAEILSRPANTGEVQVQHVLIGWKDIAIPGRSDPKAQTRSKADADKLAKEIFDKAVAGADFKDLMKQYSEDPGSKDSGMAYPVSADAPMVEPFKKLSLRLKEGEVGMVISDFGWHVIKRVPPPPPDALESADILKRDPVTQKAKVKHILLGWTDVHADDPRGVKRSRADLEKLVKATVAKLQKGAKIEPLMKELSEDPGSAASGDSYDVTPDAGLVEPFKNLSLRLKVGEVGVVKTDFGIHIIQRVE
ncbi:MAG TPA: peptidylprolyl isomerase [Kofleriaceae bacterium]|nr:peptidylprolyl isomerase [Kofleriaceae bacterium]